MKTEEWYIPPTRGRDSLGFLSPRDVPRAVVSAANRPEGKENPTCTQGVIVQVRLCVCVLHLANLALLRPGASEWAGRVLVQLAGGASQPAGSWCHWLAQAARAIYEYEAT